jgi:hypothetical protein
MASNKDWTQGTAGCAGCLRVWALTSRGAADSAAVHSEWPHQVPPHPHFCSPWQLCFALVLRVPSWSHSRHSRALRRCRIRQGVPPVAQIQEHLDEAMQPDGIDLEYVYVQGLSRPQSPRYPNHNAKAHRSSPTTKSPANRRPQSAGPLIHGSACPRTARAEWGVTARVAVPPSAGGCGAGTCATRPCSARLPPRHEEYAGATLLAQPWDDSPVSAPARASSLCTGTQVAHGYQGSWVSTGARLGSGALATRCLEPHECLQICKSDLRGSSVPVCSQQVAALRPEGGHLLSRGGGLRPGGGRAPAADPPELRPACGLRGSFQEQIHATGTVYIHQLNDLLTHANQCSAALGSKFRYVAARTRKHGIPVTCWDEAGAAAVERRLVMVRCSQ